MTKKYIDAELLKDNLRASCLPVDEKGISGMLGDEKSIADYIDDEPAADVQEVRRGAWVYGGFDIPHCSECGKEVMPNNISLYCPNCGCKMDGGKNGTN